MTCSTGITRSRIYAALLIVGIAATAHAADDKTSAALRTRLGDVLPGASIGEIKPLPASGLYEVVYDGSNVVYTDAAASLLFIGNLYRTGDKQNLTEARKDELLRVDFAALPLDKAFKIIKGDGRRQIAIFSDPDCPYCKKLEQELEGIDNVTIHTFLYPLPGLHPDAERKSKNVWCAPDRAVAWREWMLNGKEPATPATECSTPIADIAELSKKLKITGTPGIVFANGKLVPGAIPRQRIEQLLAP